MVPSKAKKFTSMDSSGKRKRKGADKTGRPRKKKNPGVLQFFEDAANEVDEDEASDDSNFSDDMLEDEIQRQTKVKIEPGKANPLPFLQKDLSVDELEKMVEERYKPGSALVTYSEDVHVSKLSVEGDAVLPCEGEAVMPSCEESTIWKVKCVVGRERHSAFCLMQKHVHLQSLETKLPITSAFALEHVKGFIYIEAERQVDVNEACRGLCFLYSSQKTTVPKDEVFRFLSGQQRKCNEVPVGSWARVKKGRYKGDLAQVVAVNAREKATVKLIPRIDLQAMADKYGGGIASKKTATPTPRLISSTELEDFRPLIQYRRDRDTGQFFEVLDGLMLKDGYLYKKVPISSLSYCGVMPSEYELLKFEPLKKVDSDCEEWLTHLYGEQKSERSGGKGESSSSSRMANGFQLHDLVFFSKKEFGVIVGTENNDNYKVLKEGPEGPLLAIIELHQLKSGSFARKFTALDHHLKTISITDTVKVLEGPLQGRQGIVKQIFKGTIFFYDENEQENSGYICCKSDVCKNIKVSDDARKGKNGDKSCPLGCEDFLPSPKSPLSPKKTWQASDNNRKLTRENKGGTFSIGQSLRFRAGPLKGYLCHVMAIQPSEITVKLDSQQKVLIVKRELLSKGSGKSSSISSRSSLLLQPELKFPNPHNFADCNTSKGVGDATWKSKVTRNQNSSWGIRAANEKAVDDSQLVRVRKRGGEMCKKTTSNVANFERDRIESRGNLKKDGGATGWGSGRSGWGKAVVSQDRKSGKGTKEDSWGKAASKWNNKDDSGGSKDGEPWRNQAGGPWSKQARGSSLTKQTNGNAGDESRQRIVQNKSFSADRGFGGWNKNGMVKKDDSDQQGSWDRTKTFDVVRGSDGRSGRGGRDQFGRGRSFGRGQSFGWNKGGQGYHAKDRLDTSSQGKDGGSDKRIWSKADVSLDAGSGEVTDEPWGKAPEKSSSRYGFGGTKMGWETNKIDGGRGSGGRSGRGGGRGGRDQFGRGRSFGRGQPSGEWEAHESHGMVDGSDKGGFGGRGGSDTERLAGRGRSDHGGKGGRRRTDRGGFRGRGRSERGGFGGRGRWGSGQNGSSWNKGNGSGNGAPSGAWNKMNAADGGESFGWNQARDAKGASEDRGQANPRGKAAGSPWGKGND